MTTTKRECAQITGQSHTVWLYDIGTHVLQMYVFPKASLLQQGLKAEALKEFVTVEYELVPPTTVPSPSSWLNSLLSFLYTPFSMFFSAFNHQEESGMVS